MQTTEQRFDFWCLVELFGHQKIAGRCTEQNIAGTNMLRVDVPETDKHPAFTRFLGSSAIYAINPVDEETARMYAERLSVAPIDSYTASTMVEKQINKLQEEGKLSKALPSSALAEGEEDDDLTGHDLPW